MFLPSVTSLRNNWRIFDGKKGESNKYVSTLRNSIFLLVSPLGHPKESHPPILRSTNLPETNKREEPIRINVEKKKEKREKEASEASSIQRGEELIRHREDEAL